MIDGLMEFDSDDALFNSYYHGIDGERSKYYSINNFNQTFTNLENSLMLCNYKYPQF